MTQITNPIQMTIAERKGIIYTSETSENTYKRLRTTIRNKFSELIESGVPLVTVVNIGQAESFKTFMDQLDPESRHHYDCKCCQEFMLVASTIGYLDESLETHSLIQDCFQEVFENHPVEAVHYQGPLLHIPESLTNEEKNGWAHFYLVNSEDAAALNKMLVGIDTNFVRQWNNTLRAPTMRSATLEKITAYLVEKLFDSKPIGLLHPLIKFIKMIEHNKTLGMGIYDIVAAHYRFPKWGWLLGIKSSSAGNVISYLEDLANGETTQLDELVSQLNHQTDPIRHKRAVKEASEQALKADMDKLIEMGIPRVLERAMVVPSDLTFDWTQGGKQAELVEEKPEEELTATEKVMKKLLGERKAKKAHNTGIDFLDNQLNGSIVEKKMSLAKFKELLPTFTSVSLITSPHANNLIPVIITKPVDDADYSQFFTEKSVKFQQRCPARAISSRDMGEEIARLNKLHITDIRIDSDGAVLGRNDAGRVFMTKLMGNAGTMLLGDDVQSTLKAHIRGWTEMSKHLTPETTDEPFFVGLSIVAGHVLHVEDLSGVKYSIHITSAV